MPPPPETPEGKANRDRLSGLRVFPPRVENRVAALLAAFQRISPELLELHAGGSSLLFGLWVLIPWSGLDPDARFRLFRLLVALEPTWLWGALPAAAGAGQLLALAARYLQPKRARPCRMLAALGNGALWTFLCWCFVVVNYRLAVVALALPLIPSNLLLYLRFALDKQELTEHHVPRLEDIAPPEQSQEPTPE